MEQSSNWRKRTKGKHVSDFRAYTFYSNYMKVTPVKDRVTKVMYTKILNDIIDSLTTAVVDESLEIRIPHIGKFRVIERKMKIVNNDGKINYKNKVDWKRTWELWRQQNPTLSDDDILLVKDKTLLIYENKHSPDLYYSIKWDNFTINLANKECYKFKASHSFTTKLSKTLIDENKNVMYYG
jgi:nucleoid DNA-binding protein